MRSSLLPRLLLALVATGANALADDASLRQQIAAERAAIDTRFERDQAECGQRFALNACLDDARLRRRQAMATLQARQLEIDTRQRVQRAAERQRELERKSQQLNARQAATATAPQPEQASAGQGPSTAQAPAIHQRSQAVAARAKASERATAARKLQADIKADQARIAARIAKRSAQGQVPAPLPALPAASASGP